MFIEKTCYKCNIKFTCANRPRSYELAQYKKTECSIKNNNECLCINCLYDEETKGNRSIKEKEYLFKRCWGNISNYEEQLIAVMI
jgi:hypothetical protein